METIGNLLAQWSDHAEWLPITVWAAIILFVLKEVVEWKRRRAADLRKVRALKRVVARECELNFSAMTGLTETLNDMQEVGVNVDAKRVSVMKDARGDFLVQLRRRDGCGSGYVLRLIQRETILKHLVEIASLDENFYSLCETAVSELAEAEHVHSSLVYGPPEYFPSSPENYYEGVIDYGLKELKDSVCALKALYLSCTGTELTKGRLR